MLAQHHDSGLCLPLCALATAAKRHFCGLSAHFVAVLEMHSTFTGSTFFLRSGKGPQSLENRSNDLDKQLAKSPLLLKATKSKSWVNHKCTPPHCYTPKFSLAPNAFFFPLLAAGFLLEGLRRTIARKAVPGGLADVSRLGFLRGSSRATTL